jgi:F-type H+-transporting ATPase subunit a
VTLAFVPPTVEELFEFKPIFTIGGLEVTFPTLVLFGVTLLLGYFFWSAFRKPQLVPAGAQNVGESLIDFVDQQIVLPVIGPEGRPWVPFLATMFFFVFFNNMMSIIPGIQFPVTSRMAYPTMLAALSWIVFNAIGIREQGFFGYLKGIMFPPGVPKPIYILLTPIEVISTIIVRPLTLAVRLFANMVAGHMLLAVLFIGTAVFFESGIGKVTFVLPFALATVLTLFEIFVAGMQAFIITILTAVYIAGAAHPEH